MSKPKPSAKRSPRVSAPARSLRRPDVGLSRLESLIHERDRLLTELRRLGRQHAGFSTNRPSEREGMVGTASGFSQLQKACDNYINLFDFAPLGYVVLDGRGQIQEINHTGAQLLGQNRVNLARTFVSGFVVKEDIGKFLNHLHRCKVSRGTTSTELRLKQKTGVPLSVELVTTPVESPSDHLTQYRTAMIDITQRRLAEGALQQMQQDYHALVNSIEGLVWEGKAEHGLWRFTFVSHQAQRLLGYPVQRWFLEPDFWEHRLHPEDRQEAMAARARALAGGQNHVLEYRMIDAHRRPIWVRDSVNLKKEAGSLKLQGILINITELKEMDASLRHAHQELEARVQERTAELALACDRLRREMGERKRLEQELLELTETGRRQGLDLHGNIGQSLAGIALMVKSLGLKLEKSLPVEADQAERIHSLVDQTMARAHDPAQDLVAFGIQEKTLPQALKGLAARAETLFEVPCSFKPNGTLPPIDSDVFTQFYNIAVEAVVNAIRYASAGAVVIGLTLKSGRLSLIVQSTGHSFPTPLHHSLELGMKLMNYRAKLISADLQIREGSGHGPVVTCTFPAKPRAAKSV